MAETQSDMQAVIVAAKQAAGVASVFDGDDYLVGFLHSKDMAFVDREELNEHPKHRKAHITLATLEAFTEYVKRYHSPDCSIIFADPAKRQLVCVFDDYPMMRTLQCLPTTPIDKADAGKESSITIQVSERTPSWRLHRAFLTLTQSWDLNQWLKLNDYVSQDTFAEFLNLRASQIVSPAAADILEIVTQFEAVEEGRLMSKVRARDGRVQFAFERESKVLSVDIPAEITIRIPLFAFAAPVDLTAQIRFRVRDRGLHFCLIFPDLADLLEASWHHSLNTLGAALPEGSLIVEGQP